MPLSLFWVFGEAEPALMDGALVLAHVARWVSAAWHLMARPIAAREPGVVDRAAVKRARRADVDPAVTVITLRQARRAPSGEEPRRVDWRARWLVRGFWRQQWYPSLGAHRAIWIDAYVKGPEDRPLRIREHVYAWRR
jgi:hypothetical protein